MDISGYFQSLIDRSNANQTVLPEDYVDNEGLLVCGVCGRHKEIFIKLPIAGSNEVRKVRCVCDCWKAEQEYKKKLQEKREEQDRIAQLRKTSLLDSKFSRLRFETSVVDEANNDAFKTCKMYAENFDNIIKKSCQNETFNGLLLCGPVGTGKSHLAACIANYLIDHEHSVLMTSFVKLLELGWNNDEETQFINRVKTVDLVIFDDFGAERQTDYALEKVYNVIDTRYRTEKPMIFTTNLYHDDIKSGQDVRYRRTYDRIIETCYPVQFSGESRRRKLAHNKADAFVNILKKDN